MSAFGGKADISGLICRNAKRKIQIHCAETATTPRQAAWYRFSMFSGDGMRKLAIAVAVTVLIGTPAFAADMAVKMPVKAPPPAPAPIYSWTGWYFGGNIGGGWGHRDIGFVPNDVLAAGLPIPSSMSFDTSGVIGGLQAGF